MAVETYRERQLEEYTQRLEKRRRKDEQLLQEALDVIKGLAEQQAMEDGWWKPTAGKLIYRLSEGE